MEIVNTGFSRSYVDVTITVETSWSGELQEGDLIEYIFGARVINSFLRLLLSIVFGIIPAKTPYYFKVKEDWFAGVRVRIYIPRTKKTKAALVYFHGGGWCIEKPADSMYPLLLYFFFFCLVIYILWKPMPSDLADRKKLQCLEFSLRFLNEYLGDLIEYIFGARVRNSFLRLLLSIVFGLIPVKTPYYCKVKEDWFAGVRVRIYIPRTKKTKAALVYFHGGGWCIEKTEYYDSQMYQLVDMLGLTIFNVDYRLAPEHPFPAAVDDCENVVRELYEKKFDEYDIDRSKIAVAGDSAGGNLSAVTAQRLVRTGDGHYIRCHIMIYPVIHIFGFQSTSYLGFYERFKGMGILNPKWMARWILFYTGKRASAENVKKLLRNQHLPRELDSNTSSLIDCSKISSQLRDETYLPRQYRADHQISSDFARIGFNPSICPIFGVTSDLPPALVITSGYDILRDEGIEYVSRLLEKGVSCEWKHYKNAYHGVMNMPYSECKQEMLRDVQLFLQDHLIRGYEIQQKSLQMTSSFLEESTSSI